MFISLRPSTYVMGSNVNLGSFGVIVVEFWFDRLLWIHKRHKSKTMASLCNVDYTTKENKTKAVIADRKLIQKLFNVSRAGRNVDMEEILSHELLKFPPSLAKTNRKMNSTSKSDILSVLSADIQTPPEVPSSDKSPIPICVPIDGHAMIQDLGILSKCKSLMIMPECL